MARFVISLRDLNAAPREVRAWIRRGSREGTIHLVRAASAPAQPPAGHPGAAGLTQRERQVLDLVVAGHPSKAIAGALGISRRTVENHRAAIMRKTCAGSLAGLIAATLASRRIAG